MSNITETSSNQPKQPSQTFETLLKEARTNLDEVKRRLESSREDLRRSKMSLTGVDPENPPMVLPGFEDLMT